MIKGLRNQKGVTLIELLAVVAIMATILMAISAVQLQFMRTYTEVKEGSFNNDETAFFMNVLNDEVRNATEISVNDDSILLTNELGETTTFIYDDEEENIRIQKQNGMNIELLNGVQQFQGNLLDTKKKLGVQLNLKIASGQQLFPIQFEAYSYIGVKGN